MGGRAYAGVLHRLDRDTSGALAIALSRDAHSAGRELFSEHAFDRTYLAIVRGYQRAERGTIEAAISDLVRLPAAAASPVAVDAGRHAVTHYRVLERFEGASVIELILETGRQHQIRLHLKELGHPLTWRIGVYVEEGNPGDEAHARQASDASRVASAVPSPAESQARLRLRLRFLLT